MTRFNQQPSRKEIFDDTDPDDQGETPMSNTDEMPTRPGFYQYNGGAQLMAFLLDTDGQWWVFTDGMGVSRCAPKYISQAFGVWQLELVWAMFVVPQTDDTDDQHFSKNGERRTYLGRDTERGETRTLGQAVR